MMCYHSFGRPTYCVRFLVGTMSTALLNAVSSLDMSADPNLLNVSFLSCARRESIKSIMSQQPFRTANHKVVVVNAIVSFIVRMGEIHMLARFGIVKRLTIDELFGTLLIDRCIHGILQTERKVVPWPLRPVEISTKRTAINLINDEINVFAAKKKSPDDAERAEHHLCRVPRQITITGYTQAPVLVRCLAPGLMTIEIHRNIVVSWCSMTPQGAMNIQSGQPFYVYIANLTTKRVNLPKFMIVTIASKRFYMQCTGGRQ